MRTLTRWSLADYHQMRDRGILDHRRCELINGEIWDMAPEGEFHRFVNHRGVKYLRSVMQGKAEIFEAHPITLDSSEPQPDIAVVRLPDTRYLQHHPYPEDIYWLIEVADTTLAYDLEVKKKLYSAAGIQEYWVINVAKRELIIFSDLQNGEFQREQVITDGTIYAIAFPDVALDVAILVDIPESA